MTAQSSDALVFFGATGDLAYKQIFPALQALVKRGALNVPIVGVAWSQWTLEQLRARAQESVEKHGGLDPEAFATLVVAAYSGAMAMAKASQSAEPLRVCAAEIARAMGAAPSPIRNRT